MLKICINIFPRISRIRQPTLWDGQYRGAIGVENIGSDKDPLTPAQLASNEELIRYLKRKYPIEYVIGHYEYTRFKSTNLWKESDSGYSTEKTDPGIEFMKRIREQIKDLNIKGAPKP